jgi:nucleoid-associated protein YgaU
MPVNIYSRYHGLKTFDHQGRLSLEQRPIQTVDAYPDGLVHTLKRGETLDLLAARYYGREDLWWRIADANPGRFPLDWEPGDTLNIPPIRVATRMPRK